MVSTRQLESILAIKRPSYRQNYFQYMFKYSNKLLNSYVEYIKEKCGEEIQKEQADLQLNQLSNLFCLFGELRGEQNQQD